MNKRLSATGDIHGCFDSLTELVEYKIQLQKNDKLILIDKTIIHGHCVVTVTNCKERVKANK
ncbi:MAG: hypothetical protein K8R53_15760 [Bacteroidales bacterium]|nr:hypothetical protein [Bacteroidales bacterium]